MSPVSYPQEKSPFLLRVFFYAALWCGIVLSLLLIASLVEIVPAEFNLLATPDDMARARAVVQEEEVYVSSAIPITSEAMLSIRSLGIVSPIIFPEATDYNSLRAALNKGVAHYPLSPKPDAGSGNVFLFGHSSARAVEPNPARTVFTRLNKLKPGDTVEIWYKNNVYLYRVNLVRVSPPEETVVYFSSPNRMITLSTCWPVGDPENRFIVQAEFVRQFPLNGNQVSVGAL